VCVCVMVHRCWCSSTCIVAGSPPTPPPGDSRRSPPVLPSALLLCVHAACQHQWLSASGFDNGHDLLGSHLYFGELMFVCVLLHIRDNVQRGFTPFENSALLWQLSQKPLPPEPLRHANNKAPPKRRSPWGCCSHRACRSGSGVNGSRSNCHSGGRVSKWRKPHI
jgi:hypothetical protein